MRVLVTGHDGYLGTVLVPLLQAAGHDVVGLDTHLFGSCAFGPDAPPPPEIVKDVRDVRPADLEGFDAVVHLAGISNDPLGDLDPECTYDVNHRGTVRVARGQGRRRPPLPVLLLVQPLRRRGGHPARRVRAVQPGHPLRVVQGARRA